FEATSCKNGSTDDDARVMPFPLLRSEEGQAQSGSGLLPDLRRSMGVRTHLEDSKTCRFPRSSRRKRVCCHCTYRRHLTPVQSLNQTFGTEFLKSIGDGWGGGPSFHAL